MAEFITFRRELEVATKVAYEAGAIMLQYFDGDQAEQRKDDGTELTIADTTINDMVIERLAAAFPDDGVIGEEGSSVLTNQPRRWYCDPIDGTKGYTWGLPLPMFSLGLEVDDELVAGVAFDPFLGAKGRLFAGVTGEGSFCNGERLRVSNQGLALGRVAVTSNVQQLVEATPQHVTELLERGVKVASFPAGVVHKACLVARGKLVGCIQEFTNPHDIAAVQVIVEEAGGVVTDWDGNKPKMEGEFKVVISNGVTHGELVDMTGGMPQAA
jgi:fructose-1,6-bisphosphatase/inositol monophosphatase family enzyme